MDTIAAAAAQHYPPKKFQVFVLDDAAESELRQAIGSFNTMNRERGPDFHDVVYYTRDKPLNQRHWLSRTVPHLIKNRDLALASPPQISYNILTEDGLGQDVNVYRQILEPFRDFLDASQCSGSGYVMRRQAIESIGGWPLANIGEDILCSHMLQVQGWKTRYIPDQLRFGLAPDSFHALVNQRIRWVRHPQIHQQLEKYGLADKLISRLMEVFCSEKPCTAE